MGMSAGCSLCVGVLTGTATAAELETEADHVLESIADIELLLDRGKATA
jgi:phosphoglycolate phosphatase